MCCWKGRKEKKTSVPISELKTNQRAIDFMTNNSNYGTSLSMTDNNQDYDRPLPMDDYSKILPTTDNEAHGRLYPTTVNEAHGRLYPMTDNQDYSTLLQINDGYSTITDCLAYGASIPTSDNPAYAASS